MPRKKGSKVAASQARAKEAAKKKAKHGRPSVPAAAYTTPPSDVDEAQEELESSLEGSQERSSQSQATTTRARPQRSLGVRRERHAVAPIAGASLRREVLMIGAISSAVGVGLAVLKLVTELGA